MAGLSLRWKLTLVIILFGTLVTGILSVLLFTTTRDQMRADFRQRLTDIVAVGALSIDAEIHRSLRQADQEGGPDYLTVKRALQRIKAKAADIHFVYTMRADAAGRIVFVVDAETQAKDMAHLGQVYTDASPFLKRHFADLADPVAETQFYSDRWGTWLTGYAPFYDQRGQRAGVLGVDIKAARILGYEKRLMLLFAAIFLASIVLSTLLGIVLGNRLAAPVLALGRSAERIGRGDFTSRVTVHSRDELGVLANTFNVMTEKLEELVNRLRTEITSRQVAENKYRSIFENAMEGIFQSSFDGRLMTANPQFAQMLGYDSPQEVVETITDIAGQLYAQPERRQQLLSRLESSGRVPNFRIKMRKKDGTEIWTELTARVVREEGAEPIVEGLLKDISERLLKEAAEREQEAAQVATMAKSAFLANMSHEIRTPMNAVIGLTHLALKTDLTAKQADYLNKILLSSQALLRIINDILDFSKIEAGKLSMETVPFDIEEVMNNLTRIIGVRAEEKGLEILFRLDNDVPYRLMGDPLRLEQVLVNLASNAIKFTEAGHIVISVSRAPADAADPSDRIRLQFSVADTGIGLTAAQKDSLFRSFSQADASVTRKYGGTGLGLAICKRLVEMMGGRIYVESAPESGSTFYFTAGFALSTEKTAKAFHYPEDLKGMRVLVVDDNGTAREIICEMLESFSFRAHQAPSGKEALADLKQAQAAGEPFDLVIMDWKMPGMDGIAATRSIQEHAELDPIPPILMLTAYSRDDVRRQAETVGIDTFLIKPVNPSLLFDAIMSVFSKTGRMTAERTAARPSDGVHGLDRIRGARILLVEDNEINRQVAVELMQAEGFSVETAVNGKKALSVLSGQTDFDAVLMDIQMPEMDGHTATRKIRALDSAAAKIPIIAMTAHALDSEKAKCFAAGMNDHVSKPIDPDTLFAVLVKWIEPRERLTAPPPHGTSPNGENATVLAQQLPSFDTAAGLRRVAGNAKLYRDLLASFADKHAGAAGKINYYTARGQFGQAEALAHTIKGMAGNLGADGLQQAAAELESALKSGRTENLHRLSPALAVVMAAAVAEIQQMTTVAASEAGTGSVETTPSAAPAQIIEQLERIRDLIQTDYGKALQAASALRRLLPSTDATALVGTLIGHMEAFDESQALACLEEIATIVTPSAGVL